MLYDHNPSSANLFTTYHMDGKGGGGGGEDTLHSECELYRRKLLGVRYGMFKLRMYKFLYHMHLPGGL